MVDPPNLRIEVASNRRTGGYISLHDIADNFDSLAILQYRRVIICLLDDCVPLFKLLVRRKT